MKSKYDLIKEFPKYGFTKGAEIGVSMGYFSEAMFKAIPNLELWCVDNWEPYRGNRWAAPKEKNQKFYEIAKERLSKYNAHLIKDISMNAVKQFKPESLDFVYIDANHSFDYVMEDLINWTRIVRKGGMVFGDDYYNFRGAGVIEAVDAYTKAHGITFQLTDPYPDVMDRGFHEKPTFYWIK